MIDVLTDAVVGKLTEWVMDRFAAVTGIAAGVTVDMLSNVKVIVLDVISLSLEEETLSFC